MDWSDVAERAFMNARRLRDWLHREDSDAST